MKSFANKIVLEQKGHRGNAFSIVVKGFGPHVSPSEVRFMLREDNGEQRYLSQDGWTPHAFWLRPEHVHSTARMIEIGLKADLAEHIDAAANSHLRFGLSFDQKTFVTAQGLDWSIRRHDGVVLGAGLWKAGVLCVLLLSIGAAAFLLWPSGESTLLPTDKVASGSTELDPGQDLERAVPEPQPPINSGRAANVGPSEETSGNKSPIETTPQMARSSVPFAGGGDGDLPQPPPAAPADEKPADVDEPGPPPANTSEREPAGSAEPSGGSSGTDPPIETTPQVARSSFPVSGGRDRDLPQPPPVPADETPWDAEEASPPPANTGENKSAANSDLTAEPLTNEARIEPTPGEIERQDRAESKVCSVEVVREILKPKPEDGTDGGVERKIAEAGELKAIGCIGAASIVYRELGEDGVPIAALKMGELYDPVLFDNMQTPGRTLDPATSCYWYRIAVQANVPEASERLSRLKVWLATTESQVVGNAALIRSSCGD